MVASPDLCTATYMSIHVHVHVPVPQCLSHPRAPSLFRVCARRKESGQRISELEAHVRRLEHEQAQLSHTHVATLQQHKEQTTALHDDYRGQLSGLRQQRAVEKRSLSHEVRRLRHVQETVLEKAGAHALSRAGVGGPEARRLLYYESLKSKVVLQPDPTLTWRGQHDYPKSDKCVETIEKRDCSPPRSPPRPPPHRPPPTAATSPRAAAVAHRQAPTLVSGVTAQRLETRAAERHLKALNDSGALSARGHW